jgi:hypothetical protein
MNPLVFVRLGFKIETRLSEIESNELGFSNLQQPDLTTANSNVIDTLKNKIDQYYNQVNNPTELQPYIKKGFEYQLANQDPSIRQIVIDLDSEHFNKNYLQFLLEKIDVPIPSREYIDKITQVFIAIARGFSIGRFIPQLESLYEIANANRNYFTKVSISKDPEIREELRLATILNKCGFDLEITIKSYEQDMGKIEELKKQFLQIQTPDRFKTINDRAETLTNKIKASENQTWDEESLHRIGYLLAIRGENPSLFQLLKENVNKIKFDPFYRYKGEFTRDEVANAKKILLYILEGYCYSYHIHYLEEELKKLNAPTDETIDTFIKLKWVGQKNQLYDVLRGLKNKGLIGNSYEDLAVILKQNVEIFQHTSLSTILKEIGKDKRPPKNKRVDLDI